MNADRVKSSLGPLDESFGITSDLSTIDGIADARKEISKIGDEVKSLSLSDGINDSTDFDILKNDLIKSIDKYDDILDTLHESVMIGAPPGIFEVAAQLISAITSARKELRMLIKDKADIGLKVIKVNNELSKDDAINNPSKSGSVSMSASDLMEMLDMAKKANTMNAIDAEFEIEEVR
jgi:hypothetical protein